MNTVEMFATQQAIIDLQSKAINSLFLLLMQYVTPEEADDMVVLKTSTKQLNLWQRSELETMRIKGG